MYESREVEISPELPTGFITLSEAKSVLGIADGSQDARVQRLIDAASRSIEDYCNAVISQRTVTETVQPEDALQNLTLTHSPAISLTSIALDDAAQTVADYRLNKALGSVRLADGSQIAAREIVVVYVAGYASVPAGVTEAMRELLSYLWTAPQRSAAVNTGIKSENVEGVGGATYGGADAVPMITGENGVALPVSAAVHLTPYVRSFV